MSTDQTAGWQPIDTVPRDGRLIDLWLRSYFWNADGVKQLGVEMRAPDASWFDGQWCNEDGNPHEIFEVLPDAQAEFWMERPDPPPGGV